MSTTTVQVRDFTFPGGSLGRNIIISGVVMLLSSRRELIAPGSPVYDYLLAGRPGAARASVWVQNFLFYFLFGAHAIEAVIFARGRLRDHGVPAFSTLWLKWVAAAFVGGQMTFQYFDSLVKGAAKSS